MDLKVYFIFSHWKHIFWDIKAILLGVSFIARKLWNSNQAKKYFLFWAELIFWKVTMVLNIGSELRGCLFPHYQTSSILQTSTMDIINLSAPECDKTENYKG